jgi:hypothetical protein
VGFQPPGDKSAPEGEVAEHHAAGPAAGQHSARDKADRVGEEGSSWHWRSIYSSKSG